MKVLIVGGDSMIGRRIQQRLKTVHEVSSTSRRRGAEYFLDLYSGETHFPPHASFDCVIHCAAEFRARHTSKELPATSRSTVPVPLTWRNWPLKQDADWQLIYLPYLR